MKKFNDFVDIYYLKLEVGVIHVAAAGDYGEYLTFNSKIIFFY